MAPEAGSASPRPCAASVCGDKDRCSISQASVHVRLSMRQMLWRAVEVAATASSGTGLTWAAASPRTTGDAWAPPRCAVNHIRHKSVLSPLEHLVIVGGAQAV